MVASAENVLKIDRKQFKIVRKQFKIVRKAVKRPT